MHKMKKIFTIFALGCLNYHSAQSQSCDTINFQESITNNWSAVSYTMPGPFGPLYPVGYIAGANGLNYTESANYFDLSATSYTYIQGVIVKFLKANPYNPANLSKIVYFRVHDDIGGVPGNIIGTAQKTYAEIKADVDAGLNSQINFTPAITIPSSKKIYVSVDFSNLKFSVGGKNNDTLNVAATNDDQVLPAVAWEFNKDDSAWTTISDDWSNPSNVSNNLDVNLWIFPYVSTTSTGCGLLPVTLLSFTASRSNNDVTLKWEVSNEINMNGYSIERADNNGMYKSVAFVAAGNHQKNQAYTITDRNAFSTSSTIQYRIKQVNADGSALYSRVISLSHNNTLSDVVFQNPFSSTLKMQFTLSSTQKLGVQLYDMQGKVITTQQPQTYSAGTNFISINTSNLKAGTYLLKINAGEEQIVYKVVKQ